MNHNKFSLSLLTISIMASTNAFALSFSDDNSAYAPPQPPPPPPMSQVNSASLHLEQTDTIYANDRMQAVVRVNYDLADGVVLKSAKLKRMFHQDDIANLGWNVSDVDAGYSKQIFEGRSEDVSQIQYQNTSEYSWLYVTAEPRNAHSNVDICLELETELNGKSSTYSTCTDSGIDQGSATLNAIPAKTYGSQDFYLDYHGHIHNRAHEDVFLFKLKKSQNISSNTTFKVKEGIPYNGLDWMWAYPSNSILNNYTANKKISSNVSMFLTQSKQPMHFSLVTSVDYPATGSITIPASYDTDTIFHVVNYFLNKGEFLVDDRRCKKHMYNWNDYDAKCISPHDFSPKRYYKGIENIEKTTSREIVLLDNYGNEAKFELYIGGKKNHDPYLR